MFVTFMFYLFMSISIINVIHFGLYLVGANYYDILKYRQSGRKIKKGRSSYVTVLIPAHNEEKSIVRCLDTVRSSTVRKIEIVVIDDASTDATNKIVREYIKQYPRTRIRLISKRKNVGKACALNTALKQGVMGDYVMTLDADSVLHRSAISNALKYFRDPNVAGVAANVRVLDSHTLLGLVQKFEYMVGYRSKKFYSVSNSEFIVGGVASTYRYEIIKKVGFYDNEIQTEDIALSLKVASLGNKAHRLVYGADVLAMTEGVHNFKTLLRQRYRWKMGSMQSIVKYRSLFMSLDPSYSRALTFYRIPMAYLGELIVLLEPIVIGYIIYLSFLALSPIAFIGAYFTITLYLIWNVMPDEHMDFFSKFKMAVYAPTMYFSFYIMNVVQLIAVVRCLINYKKILRKTATNSTWISPERAGQQIIKFS